MTTSSSAKKKTDDVFDLDVLQQEATLEPFRFRLDGKQHELPHAGMLSGEQALGIEAGDALGVLTELAGDEMGPRLMRLPAHALNSLLERWLAHAGTTAGE